MECPFCSSMLTNYDGKALTDVGRFLARFIGHPFKVLTNISIGLFKVGKTIYYDFSGIAQTDEYLYCPECEVYFISCCHCGHLNCIGSNIDVSPKKITCKSCKKDFVYATHPSDDYNPSDYL